MATLPHPASVASIRAALDKILSSPGFASSDRLARFLRYAVDETLEGRGDALKETNVGVDVFGRKPGYDPKIDGVVRTEAIKLRARLKEYYEGEGRDDAVRIDLPKGGYVAAFSERERGPVPERAVSGRWIVFGVVIVVGIMTSILGTWLFTRPRSGPAPPPSIAVLPFVDMSEEKNQEYFGDGMTEQIIDALSHIPNFQVVARSSVFALKGKQQDIKEIAQRFNVRSVLEGSVQRSGSRVRVTAQLINASDGFHLWSQSYDRETKDVFALEDDISKAIVDTLQLKLAAPLPRAPEADLEAYNLYLQGRYWYFKWRQEEVERSISYYEQALQRDPRYALAYAGLADSYTWLGFFRLRPDDVMPKARTAAQQALALDERLDNAHVALAEVYGLYDHNWDAARREFERALEINPACTNASFAHAITYLVPLGRTKEAIEEMKHARDFDPLNPVFGTYLGIAYYFDRQYDAAIAQLKKTIEMDPTFLEAQGMLSHVYFDAHRIPEARATLDQWKAAVGQTTPDLNEVALLAAEGRTEAARDIIAVYAASARHRYIPKVQLACAYAALGDKVRALDALEQSYADHDGKLAFSKTWPALDPLRSEPRFQALLVKLHLMP